MGDLMGYITDDSYAGMRLRRNLEQLKTSEFKRNLPSKEQYLPNKDKLQ
jgi:hypothetical protein